MPETNAINHDLRQQITVHVPATSANVGAGFDSVGLALNLGNTVQMEKAEGCHITSLDGYDIPLDESNLVYRTAKRLFKECGHPFTGLTLRQTSPIPITRGLGSSSACVVAGLVGANALMRNPCTHQELVTIAADMESHPDNVAPALLGGLVASAMEGGVVHAVKKEISPTLCFAAFVPNYTLATEKARALLPTTVSHTDAVFNVSRAVLIQAALCEGRLDLLPVATQDRLHERYRMPLIPGGREVFQLAAELGAQGTFISGAGPTILAVVENRNTDFWDRAYRSLQRARKSNDALGRFSLTRLAPDNMGARLI